MSTSNNLKYNKMHDYYISSSSKSDDIFSAFDISMYNREVMIKKIEADKNRLSDAKKETKAMIIAKNMGAKVPVVYDDYYDYNNRSYYIVMEKISGNTLRQEMKNLNSKTFINYLIKLIDTLIVLEKKDVSLQHKDLKPENIIINNQKEVYLIDFGISLSRQNLREGTVGYKAPEVDNRSRITRIEKVDMFSLGVIMYEFFTKHMPSRGIEYKPDSDKPVWKYFKQPIEIKEDLNMSINNMIVRLMKYDPKDRYNSFRDIKYELISINNKLFRKG